MEYTKEEYAYLFGAYCAERWFPSAKDLELMAFADDRRFFKVPHDIYDRIGACTKQDKGIVDTYAAKDKLYLTYAREFELEDSDLDLFNDFWDGFRKSITRALEAKKNKRSLTSATGSEL